MTDSDLDKAQVEEARQTYERTKKVVRRGGMVILFGLSLALAIPMVVGAIQGISDDRVKDPFTGKLVTVEAVELDCLQEAGDLVYLARATAEEDHRWEQRYRRWMARCQADNPGVYHLLHHVRDRMVRGDAPPEMSDE